MNLEQLADQFDLVTNTEEGLNELRSVILNLALTGKLTVQDKNADAQKLHKNIKQERQELYEEGEIPKPKELDPLSDSKILPSIPDSWKWVKFGDIMDYQGGSQPPKSEFIDKNKDGYIRLLQIRDLGDSPQPVYVPEDSVTKFCSQDDIMVGRYGASIGKVFWGKDGAYNVALIRVIFGRENLDANYIYYFLNSSFFQDKVTGISRSAQAGFNKGNIFPIPFPLPPLEEQQRIVQKIKTLFFQVNELEQKVQQDRKVDERLQVAVLDDLQSAETPEASQQSWQRLTDYFEQIYRKPEHIDQLKQAILNEAVRGRLVPQDPNDEPAAKLLDHIKEEKQRLYDEGEIRKPKDLPEIKDEEIPYELPKGWSWERLGNLGFFTGGGTPKKSKKSYWGGDIIWISPKDMKKKVITNSELRVTKEGIENSSANLIPAKSVLIVARSGILQRTLPVCINKDECSVNQDIKVIIPYLRDTSFYIQLMLIGFKKYILENLVKQGMTVQSLKYKEFEQALFPIPPLEEQKRILGKVEELATWCNDLKEMLNRSQQTNKRLLEALVNGQSISELSR